MAFIISMPDIDSQMHAGIWSLNIHLEIWGWNEGTNLILNKYLIFAYYFKSSFSNNKSLEPYFTVSI